MHSVGREARKASRAIAKADSAAKDKALLAMAAAIERDPERLLNANLLDVEGARARGLAPAMIDRLTLTSKNVAAMAEGLRQIAQLRDPVGAITDLSYRPTGIQVGRMRVPWACRHHLRSASERYGGCRRIVSQGRQRRHLARRVRSHPLQPGHRCLRPRGVAYCRLA
jgi:hypothetical protein